MRLELNLESVLDKIESMEWNLDAYVPFDESISMSTTVLIIDDDEEDERDEQDEPIYPASKGYKSFLSVANLQSIKNNLLEQKVNYERRDLMNAVNYYYKNDAFIQIS